MEENISLSTRMIGLNESLHVKEQLLTQYQGKNMNLDTKIEV